MFLCTSFCLFQQLPAVLLEDFCLWIVFLESLGCCPILLHCPLAVDHPSLLEALREAAAAGEYVKTCKSLLNLGQTGRHTKYAGQSGRGRSLLKLLGACIEPLQGLELKVDILTHLLKVKPIGSFLTPVLNHFIVSTSWEELQEANVLYYLEVDIHLHRGAIHQAVVALLHTIQTQVSVFCKYTLNSHSAKKNMGNHLVYRRAGFSLICSWSSPLFLRSGQSGVG